MADSSLNTLVERPSPGEAPTALRIWKWGENPNSSGPANFTQRSAELVMADFVRRGVKLPLNVNHLPHKVTDPIACAAVGWFSLEVRNDGLWAVAIEYVDPAVRDAVARGGFRYVSPEWVPENRSGEVLAVVGLAFVTSPATENPTDLLAAGLASAETTRAISALRAEKDQLLAAGYAPDVVHKKIAERSKELFGAKGSPAKAPAAQELELLALRNPQLLEMTGLKKWDPKKVTRQGNVLELGGFTLQKGGAR